MTWHKVNQAPHLALHILLPVCLDSTNLPLQSISEHRTFACPVHCSARVLIRGRWKLGNTGKSLLETPHLLGLQTELLYPGHQEFYQLTLIVVTVTQTAMSVIYLRDGNLQSQEKHSGPGIFFPPQETQLQVWVTETQPRPCLVLSVCPCHLSLAAFQHASS